MVRITLGVLLVLHAVLTAVMWLVPRLPDAPFDIAHSWLFGDSRFISAPTSVVVAIGLAASGLGLLLGQSWWAPAGLVSGAAATAFMLLYFHPWLVVGVAINVALAIASGLELSHT